MRNKNTREKVHRRKTYAGAGNHSANMTDIVAQHTTAAQPQQKPQEFKGIHRSSLLARFVRRTACR